MPHLSWFERSEQVIYKVLEALPKDADRATCEKAIYDAYPFGERAMFPYKMWLKARKRALNDRFLPPPPKLPLFEENHA